MNWKENTARIFLIDNPSSVRQGLKQLLAQESHVVCSEAGCGDEAFKRIGASGADLAFPDLSLGQESGLGLIPGSRALGIRVLVYSMREDADTIEKAFAAGAGGYVSKREMSEVLLAAAVDRPAGRRHLSPRHALSLAVRVFTSPKPDQ